MIKVKPPAVWQAVRNSMTRHVYDKMLKVNTSLHISRPPSGVIERITNGDDGEHILVYTPPNQWIVFFAHSDWVLNLGIVSAISSPPGIFLDFAREFPLISQKEKNYLVLPID